jgi:hypothetical protein
MTKRLAFGASITAIVFLVGCDKPTNTQSHSRNAESSAPAVIRSTRPVASAQDQSWTSITGPQPYSPEWTCSTRPIYSGKPISPDRMLGINLNGFSTGIHPSADLKDRVEDYQINPRSIRSIINVLPSTEEYRIINISASWAKSSENPKIHTITSQRIYSKSVKDVIPILEKEFGRPLSIIESRGKGCRFGLGTTLMYSQSKFDSDGRHFQIGSLCMNRPFCTPENNDPCANKSLVPTEKHMTINLRDDSMGTIVSMRIFDPSFAKDTGYPLILEGDPPVCQPLNLQFHP